jgi:hypothetical protein
MPATYDSPSIWPPLSAGPQRLTAATKRRSGIPTRTGQIGTRSTWWTSSPGSSVRPAPGRAHEQLRRHRLGRRLAGRALRRRVGRRWAAGRRRGTPAGRRRVVLLGVHPFQDAAPPREGGPGGPRGGGERPGRCRGGPGISRFHGLELLRCRPGALATSLLLCSSAAKSSGRSTPTAASRGGPSTCSMAMFSGPSPAASLTSTRRPPCAARSGASESGPDSSSNGSPPARSSLATPQCNSSPSRPHLLPRGASWTRSRPARTLTIDSRFRSSSPAGSSTSCDSYLTARRTAASRRTW